MNLSTAELLVKKAAGKPLATAASVYCAAPLSFRRCCLLSALEHTGDVSVAAAQVGLLAAHQQRVGRLGGRHYLAGELTERALSTAPLLTRMIGSAYVYKR